MRDEVSSWRTQSHADLKTARDSLAAGNFYAAAFFAQQAAEKALKALHLHVTKRPHIGHGLVYLARALDAPAPVLQACSELTPHYTQSRYPDAAVGTPAENYTREAAQHFVHLAEEVVSWALKRLPS